MEGMEGVAQLISTVGFPIAAFLLMYYSQEKTLKELTKALDELRHVIAHDKSEPQ